MEIDIRPGGEKDAGVLAALGSRTFYEKWKETTSAENMQRFLAEAYSENKIREELLDPSTIYLVAEENQIAVGFVKLLFTFPDIEVQETSVNTDCVKPLEISRLYVSPELIGKSIGSFLMDAILEVAREQHCDLIWLGVWEQNPAVRFYLRHNFIKAGTHKFILGDQVDTDQVMIRRF